MIDTLTKIYSHAPITEAVIELRVDSEVSQKEQEKVVQRLKKDYPHSQHLNKFNVNFNASPTGSGVTVSQQPQGFRLTSNDQADVTIITPLNIATARLAPYLGWNVFRGRAVAVWKVWKRVTKHRSVARVGIRFINRIDIPLDDRNQIPIEDYLTFYPQAPVIGTLPMISYLAQITLPTHNPLWTATLTSTVVPSPLLKHMSLLLDIDVFRTQEIPMKDDDLWTTIGEARDIKNTIFQLCITPQSERLFN